MQQHAPPQHAPDLDTASWFLHEDGTATAGTASISADEFGRYVYRDGLTATTGTLMPSQLSGTYEEFHAGLAYDLYADPGDLQAFYAAAMDAVDERYGNEEALRAAALPGRTAAEVLTETSPEPRWLAKGVIAEGWTTGVQAREKVGKGTWIYSLIGAMERGEPTPFGRTEQATAVIYTEEPEEAIREKVAAFGLQRSRIVQAYEASGLTWPQKVAMLVRTAVEDGHRVVFVDNVSRAAGIDHEEGTELARAVEQLQETCRANRLGCLVDHHHKKGRDSRENMGRGGTGLPGALDIIIDLVPAKRVGPRARRLISRGRIRAAWWERVIELNEEGTAYSTVEVPEDDEDTETVTSTDEKTRLKLIADTLLIAGQPDGRVTQERFQQLITPNGKPLVTQPTASRRLAKLVQAGKVRVVEHEQTDVHKFTAKVWEVVR